MIIVTGGCGFIGSQVVKALVRKGKEVVVVDDLTDGRKFENLSKLVISDYLDKDVFLAALVDRMDVGPENPIEAIVHMGAISSTTSWDGREVMAANYDYSKIVLNYCSKHDIPFIYASSASVYGKHKSSIEHRRNEEPLNVYGFSKLLFDNYVRNGVWGCKVVGLRLFNCYDGKTEVLTRSGFKYLKDIQSIDEVATLNPSSSCIEYHKPSHIHKVKHEGDLIHFNGRRVDILCTPDQNLYVKKRKESTNYVLKSAQEIINQNLFQSVLLQSATWKGSDRKYEIIPEARHTDGRLINSNKEKKIQIKTWLKFLGWFLSEGSVFSGVTKSGRYYRVNISQYENVHPVHSQEIKSLIEEMGFSYSVATHRDKGNVGYTINSKQLYNHLARFKERKFIPADILELKSEYLECLFDSLMRGDGHKDGSRYTTKYKIFADQFQELLLKIGRQGRLSKDKSVFRIRISNNDHPQLGNNTQKKVNYTMIPWNDFVYDITVKNSIIFIRRNGVVSWSGNCYGPGEQFKGAQASPFFRYYKALRSPFAADKIKVFDGPDGFGTHAENTMRDFVYVDDVVKVVLWALGADLSRTIVNVGTGVTKRFQDIADLVSGHFLREGHNIEGRAIRANLPEHLKGRAQPYTCANLEKLRRAGYKEKFLSQEEGCARYMQWLDKNYSEVWDAD